MHIHILQTDQIAFEPSELLSTVVINMVAHGAAEPKHYDGQMLVDSACPVSNVNIAQDPSYELALSTPAGTLRSSMR